MSFASTWDEQWFTKIQTATNLQNSKCFLRQISQLVFIIIIIITDIQLLQPPGSG